VNIHVDDWNRCVCKRHTQWLLVFGLKIQQCDITLERTLSPLVTTCHTRPYPTPPLSVWRNFWMTPILFVYAWTQWESTLLYWTVSVHRLKSVPSTFLLQHSTSANVLCKSSINTVHCSEAEERNIWQCIYTKFFWVKSLQHVQLVEWLNRSAGKALNAGALMRPVWFCGVAGWCGCSVRVAGLLFRLGGIPRWSCGDCEIFWWASQCRDEQLLG